MPQSSQLVYGDAWGCYRKAGGKVYGIIKIRWFYKCEKYSGMTELADTFGSDRDVYFYDACYYLYDSDGNCRMIEHDELMELVGSDEYMPKEHYGCCLID